MLEVLACPFCGAGQPDPPQFIDDHGEVISDSNRYKWAAVCCVNCGAAGPEARSCYGLVEEWGDKVIAEWNRREAKL